jgi:hypothetical protein
MEPEDTRRTGRLAGGIVVVVLAAIFATAGGTILWADGTQRDDAGYFSTHPHRFHSDGRAIYSEKLDLGGFPHWVGAKARVEVTSRSRAVFVGIARTSDVESYLAGVDSTTAKNLDWDPFAVRYVEHEGSRLPAAPASRDFWSASTSGAGTQSVTWKLRPGQWSVLVMNADRSRGVDLQATAGIDWSPIFPLGLGLTSGGALLLAVGALIVHSSRRRCPSPLSESGRFLRGAAPLRPLLLRGNGPASLRTEGRLDAPASAGQGVRTATARPLRLRRSSPGRS